MWSAVSGHHVIGSATLWNDLNHGQDTVLAVLVNRSILTFHDLNIIFFPFLCDE